MTDKPYSTETRTQGPLTFRIDWFYDPDGDASYLGEPTSKPDWSGAVYDLWTDHVKVGDMWYDEHDRALTENDYEDLDARGDSRKHRYVEGFQHSGDGTDFAKTGAEVCQQVIAEHGSLDQASRFYIFADVERLKGLWNERWWYTGCRVTLTVDGEELADSSTWGIESDSGKDYLAEIETDMIAQCKVEALDQLPKTIERLGKLAKLLQTLEPALKS